ncbi:hypothetical protein CC86DRAFT_11924 [Ophiobolus disseminans]|uniref:Uncharacterized protein n=1 Tax=Ophiobolus disseminans TaxID=1469910 RepID=A0A6A7AKT1_9PLEO|nr:hypothetical protein CC86DRAFT_11924 [Ophiobolus disseminans]
MSLIVALLSDEERGRMCELFDGRLTFLGRLKGLNELANDCCLFEGLGEVVASLSGETGSEAEEEEEEEEAGDGQEEDGDEDQDEDEDAEHVEDEYSDEDEQDAHLRAHEATERLHFASKDESELFLGCFDSDGVAKQDERSQAILKQFRGYQC